MPNIFLSYSRDDRRFMEPLRDYLRACGLDVWTDEYLEPGTSAWYIAIQDAILDSPVMLVLMSPHLMDPERPSYVLEEVLFARTHNKKFYTVLLEGDERSAIPMQLQSTQFVDVRGRYVRSVDEVYSRLANNIAGYLGIELEDVPAQQVHVTVEGDVSGTLNVAAGAIHQHDSTQAAPDMGQPSDLTGQRRCRVEKPNPSAKSPSSSLSIIV